MSYNHLGNNDGLNLSAAQQFRSKEISKSNVVDDMVKSNPVLFRPGEKPDHCVSLPLYHISHVTCDIISHITYDIILHMTLYHILPMTLYYM